MERYSCQSWAADHESQLLSSVDAVFAAGAVAWPFLGRCSCVFHQLYSRVAQRHAAYDDSRFQPVNADHAYSALDFRRHARNIAGSAQVAGYISFWRAYVDCNRHVVSGGHAMEQYARCAVLAGAGDLAGMGDWRFVADSPGGWSPSVLWPYSSPEVARLPDHGSPAPIIERQDLPGGLHPGICRHDRLGRDRWSYLLLISYTRPWRDDSATRTGRAGDVLCGSLWRHFPGCHGGLFLYVGHQF